MLFYFNGDQMVRHFNSYLDDYEYLEENALFTTDAERADIIRDTDRAAAALLFNFFGMLGLINATKPAQKRIILNFLKKDKKLRLSTIDDTNHDISLSVKLAHEAGLWKNDAIVNEITRFLVKLKAGQVDHIDSQFVAKWANGLKADIPIKIKDPVMRRAFIAFRDDGGKTIDVSYLAVTFKKRINKVGDGGDFKRYAKRFFGLTQIDPTQTTPTAPDPNPTDSTAAATDSAADTPKLSYYQRQKLKKQQAAAADAEARAKEAVKKAEEELKAKEAAENEAAKKVENMKVPREVFDQMLEYVAPANGANWGTYRFNGSEADVEKIIKLSFARNLPAVPKSYVETAMAMHEVAVAVNELFNVSTLRGSAGTDVVDRINSLLQGTYGPVTKLAKVSGHEITLKDVLRRTMFFDNPTAKRMGLIAYLALYPVDADVKKLLRYDLDAYNYKLIIDAVFESASVRNKLVTAFASDSSLMDRFTKAEFPINYLVREIRTNWSTPRVFSYSHPDVAAFAVDVLQAAKLGKQPEDLLFDAYNNASSSMSSWAGYLAQAINYDDVDWDTGLGLDPPRTKYFLNMMRKFIHKYMDKFSQRELKLIAVEGQYKYDPTQPDKGGFIVRLLHNRYAADLIANGYDNSLFFKETGVRVSSYEFNRVLDKIGVDPDDLIKAHPNDISSLEIKIRKDGPAVAGVDAVVKLLDAKITDGEKTSANTIFRRAREYGLATAGGDADDNKDASAQAVLQLLKQNPTATFYTDAGKQLMDLLPYCSKDTVVEWLQHAKQTNNEWIMSYKFYTNLHKNSKSGYRETLTGIVQDCIGTDVEDYVNDIVESLPMHVKQQLRSNLVGASILLDELKASEIQTFDNIDAHRLKKMFLYNDVDMTAMLRGVVTKKKKTESYVEYFARAKQQISNKKLLDDPKVSLDLESNKPPARKAINKLMIDRDHAGKHGDVYPKIDKVYNSSLEFPEFEEFRKNNYGDGSVQPTAYHGTGGIAASMVLRYGFKVISSSDPSVVGRMLGDGIYVSNKIDKVLQYVSNGGYSRRAGQKGYVLELDTNLGHSPTNYRAAGLGNDHIRSPEWCLRDPKAQIRVTKVYEVTLLPRRQVDAHLKESTTKRLGFKQHLKEQTMEAIGNVTGFIFRDGMIPIVTGDGGGVQYVDFEEALSKRMITEDMLEKTFQGPMIVFRGTEDNIIVDERYAHHMSGESLNLYVELYQRKMAAE